MNDHTAKKAWDTYANKCFNSNFHSRADKKIGFEIGIEAYQLALKKAIEERKEELRKNSMHAVDSGLQFKYMNMYEQCEFILNLLPNVEPEPLPEI